MVLAETTRPFVRAIETSSETSGVRIPETVVVTQLSRSADCGGYTQLQMPWKAECSLAAPTAAPAPVVSVDNALLRDGPVRFVSENTNILILLGLSTISGAEVSLVWGVRRTLGSGPRRWTWSEFPDEVVCVAADSGLTGFG